MCPCSRFALPYDAFSLLVCLMLIFCRVLQLYIGAVARGALRHSPFLLAVAEHQLASAVCTDVLDEKSRTEVVEALRRQWSKVLGR